MKWGRKSSYQIPYLVAVFSVVLANALLPAQTAQSSAMSPEETRARAAIDKYVFDGPAKDYLNLVVHALNVLPSNYDGAKPGLNIGMADSLETTARLKRDNPNFRVTMAQDPILNAAAQISQLVRAASQDPMQSPNSPERQKAKANIDLADKAAEKLRGSGPLSAYIKATDGPAPAQEPAPNAPGKKYDPTRTVGLDFGIYRDVLKAAAPFVDRLLANASVDRTQAQNATGLERGATINRTLESRRTMPDLVMNSVASEARSLPPAELDKVRTELKIFLTTNTTADSDLVNAAVDTYINAANRQQPIDAQKSDALKAYVSAALHNAETADSGTTSGAGRKAGGQQNRQ